MATPEEQAIQGVIDQIWDTYDVDKSGALDKEETKKFVQDTLGNLGSGDEFSQEAFDEVFGTFDKDNSGTVEKAEMVVFIKQLLGGNWATSGLSAQSSRNIFETLIGPETEADIVTTSRVMLAPHEFVIAPKFATPIKYEILRYRIQMF